MVIGMNKNSELSNCMRDKFKISNVGSPRGLVFGFGVNDADYITTPIMSGKQLMCPSYRQWREMISRAHSPTFHIKRPTYIGVSVCDEWKSFMAFRGWWLEHQIDGWQIDKDLTTIGNKIYSPEFCVFVPNWLNNFINVRKSDNKSGFVGCSFEGRTGMFKAQCQNPITGKNENLGRYRTAVEAGSAWRDRKLGIALECKSFMDSIDPRIYNNVLAAIQSPITSRNDTAKRIIRPSRQSTKPS